MTTASKVTLVRCADYNAHLAPAVQQLLASVGGLASVVKPGQTALIKPNLLTDRRPDQAVTTHPELVRAVIRELKAAGARPVVADSPASAGKLEQVWEASGFAAMCAQEDVPLLNMEKAGSVPFTRNGIAFSIAKPIVEADVIINMPKVKTHMLTILTAAVKNLYGAVPGYQKTTLHKIYPTPSDFGRVIVEIYRQIPPALSIADGVVGMEGDGPSAGSPIPLGFLAAAHDAVALDLVLCQILKIPPNSVPYLRPFLPDYGPARIQTVGESPASLTPARFRVPSTLPGRMIPGLLVKLLGPLFWFRPAVSDACVKCGRCVQACPVHALAMTAGQKPVLDPRRCIGCCCCHEVCPKKAIAMRQSPVLNFIRRGKMP